jgi:hypothetical protein
MTREELFSAFPRPWRFDPAAPGLVLDANGREVLTVDVLGEREDEDVIALAEVIVELGNAAEE